MYKIEKKCSRFSSSHCFDLDIKASVYIFAEVVVNSASCKAANP